VSVEFLSKPQVHCFNSGTRRYCQFQLFAKNSSSNKSEHPVKRINSSEKKKESNMMDAVDNRIESWFEMNQL
jgi:hypothetical protein